MKNNRCFLLLILMALPTLVGAKSYTLVSPNNQVQATLKVDHTTTLHITLNQVEMLSPSQLSLQLSNGITCGQDMQVKKVLRTSHSNTIPSPFYFQSSIASVYNQLILRTAAYDLILRVYDRAVAYRFVYTGKVPVQVVNEQASLSFPDQALGYYAYVRRPGTLQQQYYNSFENYYTHTTLADLSVDRLIFSPVCIQNQCGYSLLLMESDLLNYPGMYFIHNATTNTLDGHWAPVPDSVEQGGHNKLQAIVRSYHPYIADIAPGEAMPWRIFAVAEHDKDLADMDIVYELASPSRLDDTSWIRPGKVAWEWWNAWNLKGVSFRTGVNDSTYQYYIDFASQYGIEYVILDEGWAVNKQADLMQVVPEIHLEHLVQYAAERNVKLILWAGYWAFNRDIEQVCRHYSQMGIAGFKVDFMDHDDQHMVAFHQRAAQIAAKYHLLLDYHGTYKPTGLNRTYPNVINFEGIYGLEQMKGKGDKDQVSYDVQIPFIRYAAGPADYTQGAMHNVTKANYYPCYTQPMSQGTRCHQLGEYIVFFAPLTMLCDVPTAYMQESECTQLIASLPTVWDETRILDGKIGEYIITARRHGDTWYIGAINSWTARDITIDLSSILRFTDSPILLDIYQDGINADNNAEDYLHRQFHTSSSQLQLHLAPGGGCLVIAR